MKYKVVFKSLDDAIFYENACHWGYTPNGDVFPKVDALRFGYGLYITTNRDIMNYITNYAWFKVEE